MAHAAVVLVSFLPFVPGLAAGGSFYYRDLATYFFPVRHLAVEGLRAGEVRSWNPYVNEGVPTLPPPISYPVDLLQVVVPNELGFSFLLALHVPLAAVTFLALARRLGAGPKAAALGALVYALSGFSLSCLNLYIHLEAFAWAPLIVATLIGASTGGGREVARAAAAIAVGASTMGVEITAQAVACGLVLSARPRIVGYLRQLGSGFLGLGLAALPLLALSSLVSASPRQSGFPIAEALTQSVHPVSWLQTVLAGLYGDPAAAGIHYWGRGFWDMNYSYFISLYLGGAVLCLLTIGLFARQPLRTRLGVLLVLGAWICLGKWAGLDLLLEFVPAFSRFRYPVKAFFTVLLATSLLVCAAVESLARSRRAWAALAAGATLLGLALLACPLFETLLPGSFQGLQTNFFDGGFPHPLRTGALRAIAADAAQGALPLLAIAAVSILRLREILAPGLATVALTSLIAADLLRAGAGLNPTIPYPAYALSPEMTQESVRLASAGGRTFTCSVEAMPAFRAAGDRQQARIGLWTFLVRQESLSPYANIRMGVPTTGFDATALVPPEQSFTIAEAMCRVPGTLDRLRERGVRYLLNVQPIEPIEKDSLRLLDVVSPVRTAPLSIYVYELAGSLPDPVVSLSPNDVDAQGVSHALEGAVARYTEQRASRVQIRVVAPQEAYLIVRRKQARGWSARVNSLPTPIELANGRHQAVRVGPGVSEVVLEYRAPGRGLGVGLTVLSGLIAAGLWIRSARPGRGPRGSSI